MLYVVVVIVVVVVVVQVQLQVPITVEITVEIQDNKTIILETKDRSIVSKSTIALLDSYQQ
mgnify:CR=1 FL=1